MDAKKEYRKTVSEMGKKEFTLLKMQEYGFWPENLPTPYERQQNESKEDYQNRKALLAEYNKIADQIAALYEDKDKISEKLHGLRKEYNQTWDIDKIRKDVAQKIMQESIARRNERKKQKELAKKQAAEIWKKQKAENIVFIGKGYSGALNDKETDSAKLLSLMLPLISDDKELASFLGIEYSHLRFLCYHRDVVTTDHYYRYTIPKRSGGERNIAAPKSVLKHAQNAILTQILEKIQISDDAHGFIKERSVVSGAAVHTLKPELLINIDLEEFFPTITFQRVRGMFKSFGYSGYVSSLLSMLCTYCERIPIEVKGRTRYVKTSGRILPQGSPASPMITNIICRRLDQRLNELAKTYSFKYSRYADDMSFSFSKKVETGKIRNIVYYIQCVIEDEGFKINKNKTRYLRKNNRQSVTGIVINNKQLGVPKAWVKKLRAAIHNANKLKSAGALPEETVYEISGMISWLSTVNYLRYQKLIAGAKMVIN